MIRFIGTWSSFCLCNLFCFKQDLMPGCQFTLTIIIFRQQGAILKNQCRHLKPCHTTMVFWLFPSNSPTVTTSHSYRCSRSSSASSEAAKRVKPPAGPRADPPVIQLQVGRKGAMERRSEKESQIPNRWPNSFVVFCSQIYATESYAIPWSCQMHGGVLHDNPCRAAFSATAQKSWYHLRRWLQPKP